MNKFINKDGLVYYTQLLRKKLDEQFAKIGTAIVFMGFVDTYTDLPTLTLSDKGQLYIVRDYTVGTVTKRNIEFLWTGIDWEDIGPTFDIELLKTVLKGQIDKDYFNSEFYTKFFQYLENNFIEQTIGDINQPVYLNNGVPTITKHQLNATVPSDAIFYNINSITEEIIVTTFPKNK